MKSTWATVVALAGLALLSLGVGAWFAGAPGSGSSATVGAKARSTEQPGSAGPERGHALELERARHHAGIRSTPRAEALARRLVELLRGAPADEDEASRVEAELLALGEPAAVALLAWLANEHDGLGRALLIDVLRKIPGQAAEQGLIAEALSTHPRPGRNSAMEALAERRSEPALRALNEVARTDPYLPQEPLLVAGIDPRKDSSTELPDEAVFTPRMHAMAALASTGDARVIAMLAAVLREEPDQSLRMEAARDLGQLRNDAAAVEALVAAALKDPSQYVRLAALHSLAGVLDPGLLEPLARIAATDSHAGVRLLAGTILARLREELRLAELGG
jgi:HEAT repeat protein